jgi:Skp family chaperone for outer membrane proteins
MLGSRVDRFPGTKESPIVTRNLLVSALVATGLILSMWGAAAQGQNRPGSASETRVALVDLALVFKKYEKFNRLSEEMKAAVQAREKEIQTLQAEVKSLVAQKNSLTPDTTPYKDKEQQIARKKAELELLNDGSRREFTQKEANLYHQCYNEIQDAIRQHAEARGITLVLRAAKDEGTGSANPQEVIKEVSQQVIYAVPGMDITDAIVDMLNRTTTVAPSTKANQPTKKQPKVSGGNTGAVENIGEKPKTGTQKR